MADKSYVGLFVPGHRSGELEKAFRMASPALTVDICKTVPAQAKLEARHLIRLALEEFAYREKRISLWVNAQSREELKKDFAMLLQKSVDRVRVGSIRSARDLSEIENLLEGYVTSELQPGVELVVDHIVTFRELEEICEKGRYLRTLTIGVTDLWQSVPMEERTADFLTEVKTGIVRVARKYGLLPLDAVHINYLDLERFRADCRKSRELGFCGRPVVHPSQIKTGIAIYDGGEEDAENSNLSTGSTSGRELD